MWKYLNGRHDYAIRALDSGTGVEVAPAGFIDEPIAPEDNADPVRQPLDNGRALRQRKFEELAKNDPTAALLMLKELIP